MPQHVTSSGQSIEQAPALTLPTSTR